MGVAAGVAINPVRGAGVDADRIERGRRPNPRLEAGAGQPEKDVLAWFDLSERSGFTYIPEPIIARGAGKRRLSTIATARAPRMGKRLANDILTSLDEQSVVVPGTAAAEIVLPRLADSLKEVLVQRKSVGEQVERMLDAHPLAPVLTSMPGVGVRTAARILIEIGDASNFKSAAHLASYAGIAPVTRRSGSSIRGEHPARCGNRKLKRALFLSSFAALRDPSSRVYYDRRRTEGKKHNAALICLTRRRCDVLYAMLTTKSSTARPPAEPEAV